MCYFCNAFRFNTLDFFHMPQFRLDLASQLRKIDAIVKFTTGLDRENYVLNWERLL